MTHSQLIAAGFTEKEVGDYLSGQRMRLRAAGFDEAEISEYVGLPSLPPLEPEPIPFDIDGTLAMAYPQQQVLRPGNNDVAAVLWPFAKPFAATGYTAASALNRGMAIMATHLDLIADYFEAKTGAKKGGLFEKAAQAYEENSSYWQDRANKVGVSFLEELFGEAVGGAVPGVSEFALNIPYAGLLGAAEANREKKSEIAGALTEAAKRGVLGLVFKVMHPLKQYLRAPAMGAVFGLQTAAEGGDAREIAKGFGTGVLYSLTSPGGKMGLNELRRNLEKEIVKQEAEKPVEIADESDMVSAPPEAGGRDESLSMAPEAGFRREPSSIGNENDPITRRSDLVRFLTEKLDIPIRTGRFHDKAIGIFKIKSEIIRTRHANDIEVISHEIGHALHKFLFPQSATARGLSSRPFAAFDNELTPLATTPKAGQEVVPEGFAEFVRLYVADPMQAQQRAPSFYQHFEHMLDRQAPEALEILLASRDHYQKWLQQPALQRVLSQVSVGERGKREVDLHRLYTLTIDDLHPLKQIVEEMAQGTKLPVAEDPYKLARLMRGWAGKVESFLWHRPFRFGTYEDFGKSLRAILLPVEGKLEEFRAYMVSKRTLELAGRPKPVETGILLEDAQEIVGRYEPEFAQAFQELKEFQTATMEYLRDSGVIGSDLYARIKALNDDYVPLYRVMEQTEGKGVGGGMEARSPIKRIKGSWRDIQDPLESIVKNAYLYINMAEKNAVGAALVKLAHSRDGLGKFLEKIPTPMQKIIVKEPELLGILQRFGKWSETTKFRQIERQAGEKIARAGDARSSELMERQAMDALIARGRTEAEARQILDRIKKAPNREAQQKIIEKTIEKITVVETVREFGLDLPNDIAEIFRPSAFIPQDNVISVWRKGKRELYEVHPDIARTFKALDRENVNIITKLLSYPASWLRAGATLTPEFIGRNPIRDQYSAFIYSKYGFLPGVDFARGIFHLAGKTEAYWAWKKAGGDHAMLVSMDRQYLQERLGDVLQKYPVKNLIKNPIEALRVLSELGEAGTRIGEFARGYAAEGKGKAGAQAAAFASREVTLDFARKGAAGKAMNLITAFWNAGLQGHDKMVRAFIENPVGATWKAAVALTLPSVLLAVANNDDPRMKEVPQWQKDLFWIIPTENALYRIPKPFELGIIFGTIPERITRYLLDQDPHAFDDLLEAITRAGFPGVVPTAAMPILENWANRSTFFDRPVVQKDREDLLPEYQYGPYTSETAKSLGKILGKLPWIDEIVEPSPAKIENLIYGWTGGLGRYALQIADASLDAVGIVRKDYEEPARTLADTPFFKAFAVRYPSASLESVSRFYENYQETETRRRTAKTVLEKEGLVSDALRIMEEDVIESMSGIRESLRNIGNLVDAITFNPVMTGDEKRELIDILYLQMAGLAKAGNQAFDAMKEAHREAERKRKMELSPPGPRQEPEPITIPRQTGAVRFGADRRPAESTMKRAPVF